MKKFTHYAQIAAATALTYGPVAALAQTLTTPKSPVTGRNVTTGTITKLLNQFASFLITASTIIAVIVIIYGGIVWMYKGSDDGKKILTKGIIGVAIVLGVGVILSTVTRVVTDQTLSG